MCRPVASLTRLSAVASRPTTTTHKQTRGSHAAMGTNLGKEKMMGIHVIGVNCTMITTVEALE